MWQKRKKPVELDAIFIKKVYVPTNFGPTKEETEFADLEKRLNEAKVNIFSHWEKDKTKKGRS